LVHSRARKLSDSLRSSEAPLQNNKNFRLLAYVVFSAAGMFVLLGTYGRSGADPAFSRLATVYSLAKWGTFYIDRPAAETPNPFEQRTIDKVMVKGESVDGGVKNGRLISSKPPVLTLLMTAEYLALNALAGWDLDNEADLPRLLLVMSWTLVGAPYLLTLVFLDKALVLIEVDPLNRFVLVFSGAFCTQLWGFSTMINNHVPAAGMLVIAVYVAMVLSSGHAKPKPWRFFCFGLAGGLVFTFDMPAALFVVLAGLYLLYRFPRETLTWGLLGAAIPVGVHVAVMIAVTGSPLPVQMSRDLYRFEGAYWRHPRCIDALNEPKGTYLFHMLLGRCGVFSLYPILLAGVASTLTALVYRETPWRRAILTGAAGILILVAYYVLKTNNYGGESYGFRWFIAAMPILLLMGSPLINTVQRRWKWVFISLMIGVSFYSAWECTQTGWAANHEWTSRLLSTSY
jgi:hypothetical protein